MLARPSLSWLLVFVPLSMVAYVLRLHPVLVFLASALALVPLSGLIGQATSELAKRVGSTVGGLLNATFGNVTEVIIYVLLVAGGEFEVVKASLIGSILNNLVLVLGASYLLGGLRHRGSDQRFDARSVHMHSNALALAVAGLLLPTLFVLVSPRETPFELEVISLSVAGGLIVAYAAGVAFTLTRSRHRRASLVGRYRAEDDWPLWSVRRATAVLFIAAILVGVESELLTGSLDPAIGALGLSRLFVGIFVIAIISNTTELYAAVLFALRDRLDLSTEIALNSSNQIALFVAPVLVFASLLLHRPMDFVFVTFEVVVVGMATGIAWMVSGDGRSSWLQGLQLLVLYAIIGVSSLFIR